MARSHRGRGRNARYRSQMSALRRTVTLVLLAVVPVVVHLGADEAFNLPKALTVVLAASVLLALFVREWLVCGRLVLPPMWVSLAMLGFVLAVVAATVTAGPLEIALLGGIRRYTGALLYLALAVVAVSAATDFDAGSLRSIARAVVVGGGLVASYGLVQLLGLDPLPWQEGRIVISTLGNNNFVSGHMAIVVTLSAWLALQVQEPPVWRAAGAGVGALGLAALFGAASVQGFVAVGGGMTVLGVLWLLAPVERNVRPAYVVAALGGVFVLGAGLVVALGVDPAAELRNGALQGGAVARVELARAGLSMWVDHPVFGVGMDQFGSYVREYRSPGFADQVSLRWSANEAHSVPVNMLATGGLVLVVPYLAVMLLPFVLAWRGIRERAADVRTLAGVAGAFTAYLLQALVSVDVPPLALTGWVLAGAVVVASGAPPCRPGRDGKPRTIPSSVRVGGTAVGVCLVLAVLVGSALVLQADVQVRRAKAALAAGVPNAALESAESATRAAGWWPEHWLVLAQAHEAAGNTDATLAALERAYGQNPRNASVLVSLARFHAALDRDPEFWYSRALALDPHSDELAEEAAPYVDAEG